MAFLSNCETYLQKKQKQTLIIDFYVLLMKRLLDTILDTLYA